MTFSKRWTPPPPISKEQFEQQCQEEADRLDEEGNKEKFPRKQFPFRYSD